MPWPVCPSPQRRFGRRALLVLLLTLLACSAVRAETVTVFAAASLRGALDEAARVWSERSDNEATLVYAGSSAIARQVASGAPADLVILANPAWMDDLAARGLIAGAGRTDLLSNRLVLVASEPVPALGIIDDGAILREIIKGDTIATGLVDAVPAGLYAKAALSALGVWEELATQIAQTDNVRSALALVARGEAPFGIVYATDVAVEPDVHLVGTFAERLHPKIRYPAALVDANTRPAAQALLTFLRSPEGGAIFARHGFIVLP